MPQNLTPSTLSAADLRPNVEHLVIEEDDLATVVRSRGKSLIYGGRSGAIQAEAKAAKLAARLRELYQILLGYPLFGRTNAIHP